MIVDAEHHPKFVFRLGDGIVGVVEIVLISWVDVLAVRAVRRVMPVEHTGEEMVGTDIQHQIDMGIHTEELLESETDAPLFAGNVEVFIPAHVFEIAGKAGVARSGVEKRSVGDRFELEHKVKPEIPDPAFFLRDAVGCVIDENTPCFRRFSRLHRGVAEPKPHFEGETLCQVGKSAVELESRSSRIPQHDPAGDAGSAGYLGHARADHEKDAPQNKHDMYVFHCTTT